MIDFDKKNRSKLVHFLVPKSDFQDHESIVAIKNCYYLYFSYLSIVIIGPLHFARFSLKVWNRNDNKKLLFFNSSA